MRIMCLFKGRGGAFYGHPYWSVYREESQMSTTASLSASRASEPTPSVPISQPPPPPVQSVQSQMQSEHEPQPQPQSQSQSQAPTASAPPQPPKSSKVDEKLDLLLQETDFKHVVTSIMRRVLPLSTSIDPRARDVVLDCTLEFASSLCFEALTIAGQRGDRAIQGSHFEDAVRLLGYEDYAEPLALFNRKRDEHVSGTGCADCGGIVDISRKKPKKSSSSSKRSTETVVKSQGSSAAVKATADALSFADASVAKSDGVATALVKIEVETSHSTDNSSQNMAIAEGVISSTLSTSQSAMAHVVTETPTPEAVIDASATRFSAKKSRAVSKKIDEIAVNDTVSVAISTNDGSGPGTTTVSVSSNSLHPTPAVPIDGDTKLSALAVRLQEASKKNNPQEDLRSISKEFQIPMRFLQERLSELKKMNIAHTQL